MISVCVEEEKDGRVADATFNLSFYTKHKNVTVKWLSANCTQARNKCALLLTWQLFESIWKDSDNTELVGKNPKCRLKPSRQSCQHF